MKINEYKLVSTLSFRHKIDIGIQCVEFEGEMIYYVHEGAAVVGAFKTETEADIFIMNIFSDHADRHDKFYLK